MMHRKITLACLAVAAFAAWIPLTASASPVLTQNGVFVPVGTSITAKSTSTSSLTTMFGCSSAHFRGKITWNSGTQIKGEVPGGFALFTSTGASGDCTSITGDVRVTVNSNLCFETVKGTDNVTFTGCGATPFTLTATFTQGGYVCKYRAASVTGAFATNANATTNISEQPLEREEGGFMCPVSTKLDTHLDWYTTDGAAVIIS